MKKFLLFVLLIIGFDAVSQTNYSWGVQTVALSNPNCLQTSTYTFSLKTTNTKNDVINSFSCGGTGRGIVTITFPAGTTFGTVTGTFAGTAIGAVTITGTTITFDVPGSSCPIVPKNTAFTIVLNGIINPPTGGTFNFAIGSVAVINKTGGSDTNASTMPYTLGCTPVNDDCSGAISLTPASTCINTAGTVAAATASSPASACGGTANDDVWYSFVAAATSQTITVAGSSSFDAVVGLLSGTCGGLSSITCVDATGSAGTETITATGLTVGNTYFVRVYDYYSGAPSTTTFNICVVTPTLPTCPSGLGTGVVNVTSLPYSVSGQTTCGAVNDITSGNVPVCGSSSYYGGEDKVYVFTPTASGTSTITLTSTGSYTGIMLYAGCPFSGTCVASAQSSTGNKSICLTLTSGTTYYLVVDSWPSPTCNPFDISITAPSGGGLANDDCSGATLLTVGSSCSYTTYTNACASSSSETAPGCASYSGGDVWFKFVVPASGRVVINTQAGTMTDAGMAIYSGSCGSLSLIECDDSDSQNGSMSMICRGGSMCTIPGDCQQNATLTPGTTIYIRVWSYGGTGNGTFGLCVYEPATPSGTCSSVLGTGVVNVSSLPYSSGAGTTLAKGNDLTSSNTVACGSSSYLGGEDQVFIFTPTTSGQTLMSVTSGGSWTGLMLYDGCPTNCSATAAGNCIASSTTSSGSKSLNACLTAGVTYYLILDSYPSPTYNDYSDLTIGAPGSISTNNDYCFSPISIASSGGTLTGSTSGYTADVPGNISSAFCGSVENNQWFTFVATSTSATFNIASPTGCTYADGIQAEVYDITKDACGNCNTVTSVSNCYNPGVVQSGTVTATGLTVGNTYYLMIDGFAGDVCNYSISNWAPAPLPVQWLFIKGESAVNGNLISWSTGTEQNADYFSIESSTDGISFSEIGKQKAGGNSSNTLYYYFLDTRHMQGLNYYRIKEFDFDGQYSYSKMVVVDNSLFKGFLCTPYPVPSENIFNLDFVSSKKETVIANIYDLGGRLVLSEGISIFQGKTTKKLNETESLGKGVYQIIITNLNGEKYYTGKLVKY